MFQVAICDDNSIFVSDFVKQLNTILKSLNIDYKIDCFLSISEFIQEKTEREYHLLFLDIEFPNTAANGLWGADYVRNYLKNSSTQIVFISGYPKYAIQLFDYQPLQFLIKPVSFNKLKETIKKAVNYWNCDQNMFHFTANHQEIIIQTHRIIYIESFGRKKILHDISDNNYTFNDSFRNLLTQLEPYDFFSPHKSYIVNYNKITLWKKETLLMENGDIIPIGHTYQKKVKEIQMRHYY